MVKSLSPLLAAAVLVFGASVQGFVLAGAPDKPLAVPPEWNGNIGYQHYPEFFPTDVAIDRHGNVHFTDVSRGSVFRYSPQGEKQLEITGVRGFVRGVTVDSVGRIYVGSNASRDILVYGPSGEQLDTWVDVGGTAGFGTVSAQDIIYLGVDRQVKAFDTAGHELLSFGSEGSGPGQFRSVSDIAVAPDGTIWVVDETLNRLQKFDANGNYLLTVGGPGEAPGRFRMAVSVDVDSVGNVYVSDRRNSRIQKFAADGTYLLSWGEKGLGPGQFLESHGLAVGPDDSVWVAGFHAYSVQAFAGDGTLLEFWQDDPRTPGEFTTVNGIAVDNGLLFATDINRNRVQVFNAYTGKFLWDFGERGQGDATVFNFLRTVGLGPDGDLYLTDDGHTRRITQAGDFVARYSFREQTGGKIIGGYGVVVDEDGILYQANRDRDTIFKIDTLTGELLLEFGESGPNPDQLREPAGIVFDENGDLVIADKRNGRLKRYSPFGTFLGTFGPRISTARGIDRDPDSGKYVVGGWTSVSVLDSDGSFLYRIGEQGTDDGQFRGELPAVRLDEAGTLFVADMNNGRVQRFSRPVAVRSEAIAGEPFWGRVLDGDVVVWKSHFDGPYRVRVMGDGIPARRLLHVLADATFLDIAPVSIEANDIVTVGDNSLVANLALSTHYDGFDISAPPSANMMLAFSDRDGAAIVGGVKVGAERVPLPLAGWILDPDVFPATEPAFKPGVDAGLYVSFDDAERTLYTKINGNGTSQAGSYRVIADSRVAGALGDNLEACCDEITVGEWSLDFQGTYSTWWDAVSVSFTTRPSMLGLTLVENGMFAAHKVNPTDPVDLGVPNAYKLPRSEPFGTPVVDPGIEGGLFLWKATDGRWHLRVTAGQYGSARYEGALESSSPIRGVQPRDIEGNDFFGLTNDRTLSFKLHVSGIWSDELVVDVPEGAALTLTLTAAPSADPASVVRIGAGKWPILGTPLSLGVW